MLKILLILFLMTSSAQATQWRAGTGEQTLDGTSQAALIGYNSYNSIVQPLDNLLYNYCNQYIGYTSSTTLTVSAGSVVVSNSQGSIRLFLKNSSSTLLTSANLDTGSFTANTTYYVYATAATNSSTLATYFISASNVSPSGQTYYFQIGSFTTDSSTQIAALVNNYGSTSYVGSSTSKTSNVVYQALTDGQIVDLYQFTTNSSSKSVTDYTDSSSSPTTIIGGADNTNSSNGRGTITFPVKKGDYWKVTDNGSCNHTINFIPTSK